MGTSSARAGDAGRRTLAPGGRVGGIRRSAVANLPSCSAAVGRGSVDPARRVACTLAAAACGVLSGSLRDLAGASRGRTARLTEARRPAGTLAPHDRHPDRRERARPRIFSGIQPSGIVHLGNDLGAIRNYVALQARVRGDLLHRRLPRADEPPRRRRPAQPDAARWRRRCSPWGSTRTRARFRPEPPPRAHRARVAALHGHAGQLGRAHADLQGEEGPASPTTSTTACSPTRSCRPRTSSSTRRPLVPVGKDQAAHLELIREIVRAFNHRYGETFPEPQAVLTEAPVVLGTDGVRKMSKSLGNTIEILGRAGRDPEAR